jgi:hypothetical protein
VPGEALQSDHAAELQELLAAAAAAKAEAACLGALDLGALSSSSRAEGSGVLLYASLSAAATLTAVIAYNASLHATAAAVCLLLKRFLAQPGIPVETAVRVYRCDRHAAHVSLRC